MSTNSKQQHEAPKNQSRNARFKQSGEPLRWPTFR